MSNVSLDSWLAALSPEQFATARREIGQYLSQTLKKRLATQQTADGAAFMQRRGKGGKMLIGFISRTRIKSDAESISVGYKGQDARLAKVHNLGLIDRIKSQAGYYVIADYPARPWMGISAKDEAAILAILQEKFAHA
jgi:phage virion morphogenesis protein